MPARLPPLISVDDHLVEPRDLWQRWLPKKFVADGPHVVSGFYNPLRRPQIEPQRPADVMTSEGVATDFWLFEDGAFAISSGYAAVGQDLDNTGLAPISYEEMRPGCFSVPPRLADMDVANIERSLCFPTVSRFCGQRFLFAKNKELALACVRAYNDFMVEEWAGDSGGRLIPLIIAPLWDPELAAAEVRRNAARGVRAVTFSEMPQDLGLPSLYSDHWDPLFAACQETSTVVCMHIGSGSKPFTSGPGRADGCSPCLDHYHRAGCNDGLAALRQPREVPTTADRALRGADRLDALRTRAM